MLIIHLISLKIVVDFVTFRSFALHTEARSLNDLVVAGNVKAVTAQLHLSGMLVVFLYYIYNSQLFFCNNLL